MTIPQPDIYIMTGVKIMLPIFAFLILARCVHSMLRGRYEPETWAFLIGYGKRIPLCHWECVVGRAGSCDLILSEPVVSRVHAALMRDDLGNWSISDLRSKGGTYVNGEDIFDKEPVSDGDILSFGGAEYSFHELDKAELSALQAKRTSVGRDVSPAVTLLILSIFQALLALSFTVSAESADLPLIVLGFFALMVAQWFCYLVMRSIRRSGFEPEILAFFLSTLGFFVVASSTPDEVLEQVILTLTGIALFYFLGWWLRDLGRVKSVRWLATLAALGLLALNVFVSEATYGARNWIAIGPITVQPSELVKVTYIFAGAVALDRMFRYRNIFGFIAFSAACVMALAYIGDFGAALIFFATFLVISYMRSGSFATVLLAVSGAGLAGFLAISVRPYIAERFATWGNAWSDVYGNGYQQTRAMAAAAEGGLLGKGAGQGWLDDIFAANTDMVFALVSEELGLIIAVVAVLALVALAFFVVRNAAHGRSSYYVIASCAAVSMMLVQTALNVFGSLDILPFTGVTFPFVSKGGSSLLSCWMLLAFIKSSDTRRDASFIVKPAAKGVAQRPS